MLSFAVEFCTLFVLIGECLTDRGLDSLEYTKASGLGYLPPTLNPESNTIEEKETSWDIHTPNPTGVVDIPYMIVTTTIIDCPRQPSNVPETSTIFSGSETVYYTEKCSTCPSKVPLTETKTITVSETTIITLGDFSSTSVYTSASTLSATFSSSIIRSTEIQTSPTKTLPQPTDMLPQPTVILTRPTESTTRSMKTYTSLHTPKIDQSTYSTEILSTKCNEIIPSVDISTLAPVCPASRVIETVTETVKYHVCSRETVTQTMIVPSRVPMTVKFDINTDLCNIASVRHVIRKITTTDQGHSVTTNLKHSDSAMNQTEYSSRTANEASNEGSRRNVSEHDGLSTERSYGSGSTEASNDRFTTSYDENTESYYKSGYGGRINRGFISGYGGQISGSKDIRYGEETSNGTMEGLTSSYGGQISGERNYMAGYGGGKNRDFISGYGGQISGGKNIKYGEETSNGTMKGSTSNYEGQIIGEKKLGYGGGKGREFTAGYGGKISGENNLVHGEGKNTGFNSFYGGKISGGKISGHGKGKNQGYSGQVSGERAMGYGGGRSESFDSGYGGQTRVRQSSTYGGISNADHAQTYHRESSGGYSSDGKYIS